VSPNENCLEGKRCPKCKSYGPFRVVGTSTFLLHDSGTEDHDDIEFAADAAATCVECGHGGQWYKFDDPKAK